jgi:hypothetical protein
MKSDPRYTSNTVFDSFPWPQNPELKSIAKVAEAAVDLRRIRRELIDKYKISLRELYRSLEKPGSSPLKSAQAKLDLAVREAYGMSRIEDPLAKLLELNQAVAAAEATGNSVVAPGLPPALKTKSKYITNDRISMPNKLGKSKKDQRSNKKASIAGVKITTKAKAGK